MFDKLIKTFADAIAAAVAKEVATQLPVVAEAVAGAVADRVLQKLPDISGIEDAVRDVVSGNVVDALLARLRQLPFPFNLL